MVGATNKSMAAMSGAWLPQEGAPGLGGRSLSLDHVLGDACLSDLEAELEKLAMDTWGAPQWIIDAHAPDQGP